MLETAYKIVATVIKNRSLDEAVKVLGEYHVVSEEAHLRWIRSLF